MMLCKSKTGHFSVVHTLCISVSANTPSFLGTEESFWLPHALAAFLMRLCLIPGVWAPQENVFYPWRSKSLWRHHNWFALQQAEVTELLGHFKWKTSGKVNKALWNDDLLHLPKQLQQCSRNNTKKRSCSQSVKLAGSSSVEGCRSQLIRQLQTRRFLPSSSWSWSVQAWQSFWFCHCKSNINWFYQYVFQYYLALIQHLCIENCRSA